MVKSIFVLVGTLASFCTPAFSGTLSPQPVDDAPIGGKTLPEYWKDLGLQIRVLRRVLNTNNCYQSEKKFIGCFNAISAVTVLTNPSIPKDRKNLPVYRATLVKSREPSLKLAHQTLHEVGGIVTVEIGANAKSPDESKKTLAQLSAEIKADRSADLAALKSLYQQSAAKPINFAQILDWLNEKYVSSQPERESYITGMALNEYLSIVKDPHTSLEPAAFWADLGKPNADVQEYFGIGAELRKVGTQTVISNPRPESPALKAGIRANDQIIAIDGVAIPQDSQLEDIVSRVRGPKDTVVVLNIRRGDKEISISIPRGPIVLGKNVETSVVQELGTTYGVIKLHNFMEADACKAVDAAVQALTAKSVKGLILDLRGNGGGRLDLAGCIAAIFLGDGKVVAIEKSLLPGIVPDRTTLSQRANILMEAGDTVDPAKGYQVTQTQLPMVTLIDTFSASAAEIIAGTLQQHSRSVIVGQRSYGKGTVQMPIEYNKVINQASDLDPLSAKELGLGFTQTDNGLSEAARQGLLYKLTIQRFYLSEAFTNQIVGIRPEIEAYRVPNPTDDDKLAFREEDNYTSLAAVTPENTVRFPGLGQIQSCVKSGEAPRYYQAHQNDALLADYPVLVGEATLRCMANVKR